MAIDAIRTLTIAGSDTSGGGGMAADINTFEEFGTYGQVALTTIVTMDPADWSHRVHDLPGALLREQLETILSCDVPVRAMKTGMLGTCEIVEIVRETLDSYPFDSVVIDPVLVCKGVTEVLNPDTANAIRDLLLPRATITTPNVIEAGILSGMGELHGIEDMKKAAVILHDLGAKYVVVKGGKVGDGDEAIDVLYDGKEHEILSLPRSKSVWTHGAGCTFAAAITACLALGMDVPAAVRKAKAYVTAAIENGFAYNKFVGPVFRPAYRLVKQGRF